MLKKSFLSLLILMLTRSISVSQQSSCLADFDFVVKKIRADYPGYDVKIRGDKVAELSRLEQDLRKKIEKHPDSCWLYLDEYCGFFTDHHLKVRPNPGPDKDWVEGDTSSYGRNISVDTIELYRRTAGSRTLEGLWVSGWGEMAVIRDIATQNYVGV